MTAIYPSDAKKNLCPVSRVFGVEPVAGCRGPECAAWRWLPLMSNDPRFVSAVQREIAALMASRKDGGKDAKDPNIYHKTAVERVTKDPYAYTFPDPEKDRGYCGFGGPVK
ncbi:hypothetical protein [Pseudooceanicola nitratireducens]|uniref:hypothetical protein n=1 Tax=Pseudooceanicola nitratireducens TaxID=517719 RepID=UPI003C7BAE72